METYLINPSSVPPLHRHHMPVRNLQCDTHFQLQLVHFKWRSESISTQQMTQHYLHRHQTVLVADTVAGSSTERQERVGMPFCYPFREEVLRIETVHIWSPMFWIPVHVVDSQDYVGTRRNGGFGCK